MGTSTAFEPPAIHLEALHIWVHGYQFPDATDAWDGNWLRVTARCVVSGASVEVSGAILDTVSFLRFRRELAELYERLQGVATLESHEPELKVQVTSLGATGHCEVQIEITSDQLNQDHRFKLMVDQSYLPDVIRGCEQVLSRYPVRNASARGA